MDVIEIARTVLRRWYVVLPVLLVTAGLAYTIFSTAESEYETTGSFLLTDASLAGASSGGGGPLSLSPQVIAEIAQGDEVRLAVVDAGGTADYEVVTGTEEGLLRIQAVGDAEQATVLTVHLVIEEIDRLIAERQEAAGVPEGRRGTVEVLASPSTARREVTENADGEEVSGYVAGGAVRMTGIGAQGANPYAASYTGTIRVLEEVMVSPQVQTEVAVAGGRGTYEVAMRQRDTAPIIYVTGRATSPQASMETFTVTLERLRTELRERQERAGAPAASMLTLEPLSVPTTPVLIGGELRRPLIVIVGLGLLAAVSLAVLVEGLATRSRRTRRTGGAYMDQPKGPLVASNGPAAETPTISQPVRGG